MFKARIKADSLKEFIGTVGSLVDEAKITVSEDGLQVKAVDPSHVAMIESNLMKSAFDSFEVKDIEMGLDIDKFKSVLTMARNDEMVILEKDDELNRLIVNIGNLTRAMPSLDLPANVSVASGEIAQGIKASKTVSDHIALSTSKDSFRLVCEGDNQNRVDLSLGKDQLEKLSSSEDCTSLFSLEYFSLMVNSLPADRILHIMLGSDLPVKIDADLAVDDVTGAQGNVKFLLAPRIDRD